MGTPILHFTNRSFTQEDIRYLSISHPTTFEERTLDFIHQWMHKKDEFEFLSSGTTGPPKRIVGTRKQITYSATITIQACNLQPKWNSLLCLDPTHIAGKMVIVRSLLAGMTIYAVQPCANPFEKLNEKIPIHYTSLVPYQLQTILQSDQSHRLHSLQVALIGGSPCPPELDQLLSPYKGQFLETYGMTETLSHIALRNAKDRQDHFHTLPPFTIHTDRRNCLIIQSPHLPSKTVVTNDIVKLINKTDFDYIGRWDHVINSGGIKIMLDQVEKKIQSVFLSHGIKNSFFLRASPHPDLHETIELVIEKNCPLNQSEIKQLLQSLPSYERPKIITQASHLNQPYFGKK